VLNSAQLENHFKTIVVSDVHLGTRGSKAKELVKFLKKNTADNLFLNGDIIDGWQLRKSGTWKKKHTRFFKLILKYAENKKCKVVYTRGNHDDFLDQVLPLEIGNFSITRDYVYESFGKKYYIVHGDIFDSITTNLKWVAKLGDIGYTFLLWLNRIINNYRIKKGLPYYSLSQAIKAKVKTAVSYISDFETELADLAKSKNCSGIICGHIHHPSLKEIDGVMYMNSGDWVESMSALVETYSGEWKIINFLEWEKEYNEKKTEVITIVPRKSKENILFNSNKVA
jgi:UDP-2,3-diacylglucosamine pyrophosphatase LpxH